MNKKISTLLAAFLAAGFSYTVEAGVVKIGNPTSGNTYLISPDGLKDASVTNIYQLYNNSGTVASTADASAVPTKTAHYQWVFSGDLTSFSLKSVGKDDAESYLECFEGTTARFSATDVKFAYDANQIVPASKTANSLKLGNASATFAAKAGDNELFFYALTAQVAAQAMNQTVKIGDKYLVVEEGVTNVPTLVNEDRYNTLKAANPNRVVWTVNPSGQLVSPAQLSTNILTISDLGAMTLGAGTAIETVEGISTFFNATSGKSYVFTKSGVACVTDVAVTEADKKDFLTITFAPSTAAANAPTIAGYDFATSVTSASNILLGVYESDNKFLQWNGSKVVGIVATANSYKDPTYIWSAYKNADNTYSFKTNDGNILEIEGATDFTIEGVATGFYLKTKVGGVDNYVQPDLTLGVVGTAAPFGAYQANTIAFSAKELIDNQGRSFSIKLKDATGTTDNLKGNVFNGEMLIPVMAYDANDKAITDPAHETLTQFKRVTGSSDNSYLLMRESDGSIIVMDKDAKWSLDGIDQHIATGGYQFTTLLQSNMLKFLNGTGDQGKRELAYTFAINHVPGTDGIAEITVSDASNTYYVVSYNSDNAYYLTSNTAKRNLVRASFDNVLIVKGNWEKNNPLNDRYVNIAFANHSSIKYATEKGTYAALDGKVLGVNATNNRLMPQNDDKFLFAKPEGQWAVLVAEGVADKDGKITSVNGNTTEFIFKNRENGQSFTASKMYWLGDDRYAIEYNGTSPFANGAARDTMIISAAPELKYNTVQMDGYKVYTETDILDQEYRLVVASTERDYYVSENHAGANVQHLLGITHDEANAVNWRLVPMTAARTIDKDGYLKTSTDSVYVMNVSQSYNASKDCYYEVKDTLAMVAYALQNTANGEYLTYENPQKQDILSMVCQPNSENYTTADLNNAYRFVLKEKADGQVNIIGVNAPNTDNDQYYYTLNLNNKLYGATTLNTVEVERAYAQINSNDLFKVVKIDAPEYRLKKQGDVIRLFREENDHDVMYEKGEFLNLGNIAQLTDMAPALYVDTAYVKRGHNNRYQYLLVVNPTYVPAEPCTIPGHPALHPDTTYGRFLVNLIDSAVYVNKHGAVHANKYINDIEADEPFAKLGFAWGYRTADKLYLTEGQNFKKVKDVIDLDSPEFNIAKFAFRYVNAAANDENGAFKIQTRYVDYNSAISVKSQKDRYESNNGYLKTINGVVVVTEGVAKGEEFNLTAEESAPTANEGINASEVSVITKEGAVIINGAQGKKVVITNVLGQTIANTVLSSDNATVSAPAGIVVVAVEGEAAVKAIVK
jgi:hypothetical protein